MSLLADLLLRSLIPLLAATLASLLVRRASAAIRHRVWALAFLGLAFLPLLAVRLPELRIERPVRVPRVSTVVRSAPPRTAPSTPVRPTPPPVFEPRSPWPDLLVAVWALGAAGSLGVAVLQIVIAARWTRHGTDLALDAPPHTRVVQTSSVDVPMTLGLLRPTIVLPIDWENWDAERRRMVLLHEAAHVRRGDWGWLVLARLVAALYWPNPLVWIAASRMRAEGERAADDAVLGAGVSAPEYAGTLVELAASLRGRTAGAALPFVEPSNLKARVAAILGSARRSPLGRRAALGAFALAAAVVLPGAATRLVAGPEVLKDGTLDLGDGRRAEIVAITEMRAGQAASWDVNGARLPRPFPIVRSLREGSAQSTLPAGSVVRYLILRSDDYGNLPNLTDARGDALANSAYDGLPEEREGLGFTDALGGLYQVYRLVAPAGARTASVHARVPTGDWRLDASTTYDKGRLRESSFYSELENLRLSPQMPADGPGSEAALTLPPEAADRQTEVRFLPAGTGGGRFDGLTGSLSVSTPQRPEAITRIEVRSRPLRPVVLAELPLQPNAAAVYVPRRDLPESMIDAKDGRAVLPDGTTLTLESLWSPDHPGHGWNARGESATRHMPLGWTTGQDEPKPRNPDRRLIQFWFRKRPGSTPTPSLLYDGEGRLVGRSAVGGTFMDGTPASSTLRGFSPVIGRSLKRTDLVTSLVSGPYVTLGEGVLNATPGYRATYLPGFDGSFGADGKLRVEFPESLLQKLEGEVDVVLLDATGHRVTNDRPGAISTESDNWIEFNMSLERSRTVRRVRVLLQPTVWVRFPNVALEPRS